MAHALEKSKRKVTEIGGAGVRGRMQNHIRWSGLASLSQDFKELTVLAMQLSGGKAFWAEGTAGAKTVRWVNSQETSE